MDNVRFGVVGVGNIGTAHAMNLYKGKVDNAVLSALCDINPDKEEFCRKHFGDMPFFENIDEMLSSGLVDAVIVSVPHPLHSELGIKVLENACHLLVEKPEDISISKAEKLNAAAKKSNKLFGIMFNQRTTDLFIKARELMREGCLGELKRSSWIITNWYRTQSYYDSGAWRATWSGEGGGVLLNQAPHNLDLWQWICGMPSEVTAFCEIGKYHHIEVEDDVTIFVRYPNGATGTFIASTGEYPGTNRLEIAGTKGKIVIENNRLTHFPLSDDERDICSGKAGKLTPYPVIYEGTVDKATDGHIRILQNFTDAITKGAALISPGYDGIYELGISNAAYLSAWNGNRAVPVPFDSALFDAQLRSRREQSQTHKVSGESNGCTEYLDRWSVKW